ncbi:MAG: protein tyrosine/serine phosphatase [Phycisphaerales bacterium]|nr:protein tyrosine/serine phosphatase [Phycisphaerales bacterium]
MGRFVKPLLSLAAVFACGCATRPAPTTTTTTAAVTRPVLPAVIVPADARPQRPLDGYVPGIENFGFISADLWRGARPTPAGFAMLAEMGVRTVIDLEEHDLTPVLPPGVRYVSLPISGWHANQVDTVALLAAIRDNPKPVFVHCRQGRDRTGLAVAAYRVSSGMPAAEAIEELHNFRVNLWWGPPIERRIHELARD